MCKVIAIANQKGGVGKTTTTVNLAIPRRLRYTVLIKKTIKKSVD